MQNNPLELFDLPIPGSEVAWVMSEASRDAGNPFLSIDDCPYGESDDIWIESCRAAWRAAFLIARRTHNSRKFNAAPDRSLGQVEEVAA